LRPFDCRAELEKPSQKGVLTCEGEFCLDSRVAEGTCEANINPGFVQFTGNLLNLCKMFTPNTCIMILIKP
jgi:hypothetical protein